MDADVVQRFYAAFDRRDGEAMAAAYAPDAHFQDPVFGDLTGAEAGAMWRMLTRTARDLKVELAEHDDALGALDRHATRSRRPDARWSTTCARRSGSRTA